MNKEKDKPTPGSKLSKREQLRAERQRRSMIWNVILLGGGALVLALVAWYIVANARPGALPGEQLIADEGRGHVDTGTEVTFAHYPPSSGTHYRGAAEWGLYTDPVAEGLFVHNLEHGGVVFLYNCPEACPDLEKQFTDFYNNAPQDSTFNSRKILITPYDATRMSGPIVALAWGRQLDLPQFDADTMLKWYRRYVNQGPELVP